MAWSEALAVEKDEARELGVAGPCEQVLAGGWEQALVLVEGCLLWFVAIALLARLPPKYPPQTYDLELRSASLLVWQRRCSKVGIR